MTRVWTLLLLGALWSAGAQAQAPRLHRWPARSSPGPSLNPSPSLSSSTSSTNAAVRFQGVTLGQPLSALSPCADENASTTLCYATQFEGADIPATSPSVSTVALFHTASFLPWPTKGPHRASALDLMRAHRAVASIVNGKVEEVSIVVPRSRAQEAAAALVRAFPNTVMEPQTHLMVGDGFAVGFSGDGDQVMISVFSRGFVNALQHDLGGQEDGAAPNRPPL